MTLAITRLHPVFAAKITGVDLSKPIDAGTQRAIETAMDDYAVCVLPGQQIEDEHQVAFARLYGPLELSPPKQDKNGVAIYNTRVRHREIFDISNLDEDGNILDENDARSAYRLGNELWHTDSSFRQKSATWSMLHARMIPPAGGNTEFVDTRAAYDALPEAMKRQLDGLVAEHSIWHSRAKHGGYVPTEDERKLRPGALHHLVRRHPGCGRDCLYVASHAFRIIGMPLAEGQALLQELIEFATQPRFIYSHTWSVGDLVIWDNRSTLHRATPFAATGYKRDMRRATIIDIHAEVPAAVTTMSASA
jgi:alpha-ketoglutarate-dependent 2,4-dichlorophenoxyacetate dioxygenase